MAPLILGLDEGTTGVKAALFDERLRPVREARRDKVNRHPQPGWVEQDGEEVLTAVVEAIAELLQDPPGDVVACGIDHQGESVLAWDGETGAPLSRIVVWQDKRSQEVLDRLSADEREIQARSGLPFDPYFSAAKLAWLLEHDEQVIAARAAGRLRMGTVDSFLCDRLGAGFATDPSTASRTQLQAMGSAGFDPWLCERFGVPLEVLPAIRDTIGDLGVLRHPSWPVELPLRGQTVDQQAALAGSGCVVPGRVKATYGTGVFILAHAGDEVPTPAGGLLPTVAWSIAGRLEYAIDGGVFTAGAVLEWLCRELGLAPDPPALGALARGADGSAGARLLPALAGIGAPWWRPEARAVLAGLHGGTTRARRCPRRRRRRDRGRRGGAGRGRGRRAAVAGCGGRPAAGRPARGADPGRAVAHRRARALEGVRVGGGRVALAAQAPLAGAGGASAASASPGSITRPRSSRSSVRTGPL